MDMDFRLICITTTKCHFIQPLTRLATRSLHCLPHKDSPRQHTPMHMVRLRQAPIRPLRRQARLQREIPRLRSGRARTLYHIPLLRTVGDMRRWSPSWSFPALAGP